MSMIDLWWRHGAPHPQLLRPGGPRRRTAARLRDRPPRRRALRRTGPPVDRHALRAARGSRRRGPVRRGAPLGGGRPPASRLHPHADRAHRASGRSRPARACRAHGDAPPAAVGQDGDVMSRERIAGLALLSYPADAREARGEEMLATLHDVSAGSRRGFAREIADLVRLGLRMRATTTATVGARRLIADGLCLAAAWIMTLDLSTLVTQRARGMHDPLLAPAPLALLVTALALALIGRDRLAGGGAGPGAAGGPPPPL